MESQVKAETPEEQLVRLIEMLIDHIGRCGTEKNVLSLNDTKIRIKKLVKEHHLEDMINTLDERCFKTFGFHIFAQQT